MKIRKTTRAKLKRIIAFYLALNIFFEVVSPSVAMALTSGPGQPEMASFEPVGTTEMVDLFSGDFNYNIPLLTVPGPNGGYPVNLAYHAGIGMEDEASWVGLGWNINPGVISREVRGLPDDFNTDKITKTMSMNPNKTVNLSFGFPLADPPEIWGLKFHQNMRLGMVWNNYQGIGFTGSRTLSVSNGQESNKLGNFSGSISMDYNSLSGETNLVPSVSYAAQARKSSSAFGLSFHISSITGLKDINFTSSYNHKNNAKKVLEEYEENGGKTLDRGDFRSFAGTFSSGTSFSSSSFVPHSDFPQTGYSVNTWFSFGLDGAGLYNSFMINADYTQTKNKTNQIEFEGYGYLHSDGRGANTSDGNDDYRLMDFNREKDATLSKDIPSMPAPVFTHDIYMVKGQGVGGVFRPYRNDIGLLMDPEIVGDNLGGTFGGEIGPGVPLHIGGNMALSYSKSYVGPWRNRSLWSDVWAKTLAGGFYFKSPTDLCANFNEEYDRNLKYDKFPVAALVNMPSFLGANSLQDLKDEFNPFVDFRMNNVNSSNDPIADKVKYDDRRAVSQLMSYKTVDEIGNIPAYKSGWVSKCVYPLNTSPRSYSNATYDHSYSVPGYHIGEISVTNPDGNRYIYALPAVNSAQKEVTFSVNNTNELSGSSSLVNKIVNYNAGVDNSVANGKQDDHFFASTELPPYVHSYMLTAIVAPDYVDLTGNGPSDDDFGYWVKFNYSRVDAEYSWRMPFNGANYLKGYLSTDNDNKAGYTFGKKELWYLNSIETKSHIAEFTLMDRDDGFGVSSEDVDYDGNSHIDASSKSQALQTISLYAKNDPGGVPLKQVHFEYAPNNQSLCQNVWNNDTYSSGTGGGKLTLKKVWFTYMGNNKGSLSPYVFDYDETTAGSNPAYDIIKFDRWGNYKRDNYGVDNTIYPYTYQRADYNSDGSITTADTIARNQEASTWSLRKITLPSGGTIKVCYEADDYAYVHDQDAMEMVKVVGFGPNSSGVAADSTLLSTKNDYLFFELDNPSMSSGDVAKMVSGITDMYFKVYIDLKKNGIDGVPKKDYVSGYAEIDNTVSGVTGGGHSYGYVKVKMVSVKDRPAGSLPMTNPIRKAAWQYLKLERRDVLFPASNNSNSGSSGGAQFVNQVANAVIGAFLSKPQLFLGYYNYCFVKGYAKEMSMEMPSFIRLKTHDGIKYGGGLRVQSLAISDTWNETYNGTSNPGGEKESLYGQQYSYRLPDGRSSGVAAYEPLIGGEEIPYHKPIRYSSPYFIFKNQNLYMEEPVGESYYPGPSVGYSRVVVKNIDKQDALSQPVTKTREGITVNEFYTTKDFPFSITRSDMFHEKFRPKIPIPFIGSASFENHAYSQWMDVVTNDMHGKSKAVSTYPAGVNVDNPMVIPISKVEYFYNTNAPYTPTGVNQLNPKVSVLYDDAYFKDSDMGVTHEDFIDQRESSGTTLKQGVQSNMEYTYPALVVFSAMPIIDYAESMFKSVVAMHVTSQTGILMETRTFNEGSTVTAKNLRFDAYSGKPLLTSVTNDFDKPIYDYKYNASWAYNPMANAYKNDRAQFSFNVNGSNQLDLSSGADAHKAYQYLSPGDEVLVYTGSAYARFWVIGIIDDNTATIVKENGAVPASVSGLTGLVIRSGRRNQQAVSNGEIVSLTDPSNPASRIFNLFTDYNTAVAANPGASTFNFSSADCSDPLHALNYTVTFDAGTSSLLISRLDPNCTIKVQFTGTVTASNFTNYTLQKAGKHVYAYLSGDPAVKATGDYTDGCGVSECMDNVLNASSVVFNDQWTYDYVDVGNPSVAYVTGGGPMATLSSPNPYRIGTAGIWRTQKTYAYQTQRKQTTGSTLRETKIQDDGTFNDFTLFDWTTTPTTPAARNGKWTMANEVTKYNPYGFEVENKNAIGIYTSALYGYANSVQTAITANASYYEAGYDGFEDYGTATSYPSTAAHGHIQMTLPSGSIPLNHTVAHTGKASAEIGASQTISISAANAPGGYYFQTTPGKKYTVSAWFKTNGTPLISASSVTSSELVADNISIEGWRKVEFNFVAGSSTATIQLSLNGASGTSYIDDIRMQPFKSTMKTFVYDPYNLWLMAELDNQNYATFYNYDEEGTLTQVKKETVKGIQTLKTTRSSIKRTGQ